MLAYLVYDLKQTLHAAQFTGNVFALPRNLSQFLNLTLQGLDQGFGDTEVRTSVKRDFLYHETRPARH